eukprot:gene1502-32880_t
MMNSVASPSLRTASVVRGPTTSPSVASSRSLPRNKKSPSEPSAIPKSEVLPGAPQVYGANRAPFTRMPLSPIAISAFVKADIDNTMGVEVLGGDRVFNQLPSPQQLEQSPINQEPRCVIPNHTLLLDASGTTPAELSLPALQAVAPAHAADAVLDGPPAQTEVNSSSDTTLSSVACAPPTSPLASPPTEAAAEVTSSSNGLVLATPPKPTPVSADATTGSVLSARRTSPSKQNSVVVFNPPKPTPVSADATSGSVLSARRSSPSKHNSVVIKSDSMVKDAAGAIAKVLDRILHMFVAAIKLDLSHESLNRAVKAMAVLDRILHMFVAAIKLDLSHESLNRAVKAMAVLDRILHIFVAAIKLDFSHESLNRAVKAMAVLDLILHMFVAVIKLDLSHQSLNSAVKAMTVLDRILHMFVAAIKLDLSHESLNRAVKAMAVARKYIKDSDPTKDLTFLPLNRSNCDGHEDPNLFGFLVFKTSVSEGLLEGSETDINVSRVSDPVSVANAIIQHSLERGQMIMKAGGASAMHVAMTAVITARRHLKFNYGVDVMLVPAWVTSDTVSKLGRESKFLQFNVIRCEPNGPVNDATIHPSKGSYEGPAGPAFA